VASRECVRDRADELFNLPKLGMEWIGCCSYNSSDNRKEVRRADTSLDGKRLRNYSACWLHRSVVMDGCKTGHFSKLRKEGVSRLAVTMFELINLTYRESVSHENQRYR